MTQQPVLPLPQPLSVYAHILEQLHHVSSRHRCDICGMSHRPILTHLIVKIYACRRCWWIWAEISEKIEDHSLYHFDVS